MADLSIVEAVMKAVTIPVMAKVRIGHIAEARILESMGSVNDRIIMAESGNVLVMAFHPELTDDMRILTYFCAKIS